MNLKELDHFNQKLKIGQAYRITKFIFDTIPAATFPYHYFRFVAYNQLESCIPVEDENSKMQFPILIVGQLNEKGDANKSQTVWRKLEIENLNGNVIKFTMWDEMARRFKDAKLDTMQQPIIIEVSSWQVSKYRGEDIK